MRFVGLLLVSLRRDARARSGSPVPAIGVGPALRPREARATFGARGDDAAAQPAAPAHADRRLDAVCDNSLGEAFATSPGATFQEYAYAACYASYGAQCVEGQCGSSGAFQYYYYEPDGDCACHKAPGTYEFVFSNSATSDISIGVDYLDEDNNLIEYGNQLFVRKKNAGGCGNNAWSLHYDFPDDNLCQATHAPTSMPTASSSSPSPVPSSSRPSPAPSTAPSMSAAPSSAPCTAQNSLGEAFGTSPGATFRDYAYAAAYALEAATDYALAATAIDASAGTNVTSTVALAVGRGAVVAAIAGGDRVLALAGDVVLSAAESYDEDTGSAAGLTFAWSCDDPACDAVVRAGAAADAASFRGADLGSGGFVISVTATSTDGRSTSASVAYELIDDDPPAVDIDAAVAARVAASTRVVLYGAASPSSLGRDVAASRAFDTTWVLDRGTLEGDAPLAVWARTDTAMSGPATSREHDLVLASGALVAGATYALRLEATLQGGTAVGAASVSFYVARPPASGTVVASPARGYALETQFALSTRGWVTEDPPLRYAFKTRTNGTETTLRGPTLEGSLGGVVLPAGAPNVSLVVAASDALGGATEAAASVAVAATRLAGDALANVTAGLLDNPFAAPELLPDSAAFFLLQWQPDLRDTPAGASVLGARAARAASDSDGVRRAHAAAVRRPPLALRAAILASSCLFHLQDDVQDVVLEEMFCFMPLLTQPLIGFVPLPQSAGGKRGGLATALGLVLCLVVAAAVWNVYVRCRPETRVEPWRDDLEADGARDDDRGDRICPPTVVAPPH